MVNTLGDYLKNIQGEFEIEEASTLDALKHNGFIEALETKILGRPYFYSLFSIRGLVHLNAIRRVADWITSYLINASEIVGPYYLYPSSKFSSKVLTGKINEPTYLDYKKALNRKEGLKYFDPTSYEMKQEIKDLAEYLNSHDNSIYNSFAPGGEITNVLYNAKDIANILEFLRLSISVKPGKVIYSDDVSNLLGSLNNKLRWLYDDITRYDEPEKKGVLADPTRSKDPNYIKEVIEKVDKYIRNIFANAGKKDRNNLQIGEKSNNS
ncbi:MAG: hypothetical protein OH318_02980 [Candidatus Parvarchaeota archaeon]|nr:hypothetical protein [Candidatus Rehaiarchaeum fermentans]